MTVRVQVNLGIKIRFERKREKGVGLIMKIDIPFEYGDKVNIIVLFSRASIGNSGLDIHFCTSTSPCAYLRPYLFVP